ncbi:hypothetical protein PCE1_004447 [Barthelona sp. PCE]
MPRNRPFETGLYLEHNNELASDVVEMKFFDFGNSLALYSFGNADQTGKNDDFMENRPKSVDYIAQKSISKMPILFCHDFFENNEFLSLIWDEGQRYFIEYDLTKVIVWFCNSDEHGVLAFEEPIQYTMEVRVVSFRLLDRNHACFHTYDHCGYIIFDDRGTQIEIKYLEADHG